jgi:acyl-CoA reductase-like NAD-dependent aldehyde dehydrogenase
MLRNIVVSFTLLALSLSVLAQEERVKSAGYLEAQNALIRARQQQRRDMLREALKAQQVAPPVPARQMTAQEKAELRQQLRQQMRQQREDLIRKEEQ